MLKYKLFISITSATINKMISYRKIKSIKLLWYSYREGKVVSAPATNFFYLHKNPLINLVQSPLIREVWGAERSRDN